MRELYTPLLIFNLKLVSMMEAAHKCRFDMSTLFLDPQVTLIFDRYRHKQTSRHSITGLFIQNNAVAF